MENTPSSKKKLSDQKFLNALAEAFRIQEAVINATDLAIVSISPEGFITNLNAPAEKLLGYRAEEIIGKEKPAIFHRLEELVSRAAEKSRLLNSFIDPVIDMLTIDARTSHSVQTQEWTLVTKHGRSFPAKVTVSALWDDHDLLMGYVYIPTDITEKKVTEAHINSSERKFRLLAENIPGAIYLCRLDKDFSMIYINERVKDITGYGADEFLSGRITFSKIIHPDDLPVINERIQQAINQKIRFEIQYRLKHKSGAWRWIDEAGVGVFEDDQLTMLEGFFSDITSQKNAEIKLQDIVQENLRVFNNPVNLNVIAGFDQYFKRISPAWTVVLGWSEEELLAKPFTDFVHPEDIESTREATQYIASGNSSFSFENRYRCKDGSYRWLLWGAASDVQHQLIYATATDITERKKSEEQLISSKKNLESIAIKLQEQNKQLDEFAHITSHNLRSPIGNIQALIRLVDEKSSIQEYQLIFEKLNNLAKNLGQTMNDLMDTMKVKSRTDLEKTDIRFKDLLDKVVQTLEGELIQAEASVTYDFNKAPNIEYPKAYLESIFQNLLSNAIKYRQHDRKALIYFHSDRINDRVQLKVSDNGQGIDLKQFGDKLFGLHRTFHSHEEARGVGLFLIKTQIESMGGSITAESVVGQGTTFTIIF